VQLDTATVVLLTADLKNELFAFASSFDDDHTHFAIRVSFSCVDVEKKNSLYTKIFA